MTVNAFAPGVVATPLWEQLDKDLMAMGVSSAPGEAMENFSRSILLGRVAQPGDVVGTVRFLASPASDYMTGQVLIIDGGMILQLTAVGIITGAAGGVGTACAERFAAGGLVAHSCRRTAGRR